MMTAQIIHVVQVRQAGWPFDCMVSKVFGHTNPCVKTGVGHSQPRFHGNSLVSRSFHCSPSFSVTLELVVKLVKFDLFSLPVF